MTWYHGSGILDAQSSRHAVKPSVKHETRGHAESRGSGFPRAEAIGRRENAAGFGAVPAMEVAAQNREHGRHANCRAVASQNSRLPTKNQPAVNQSRKARR